MLNRRQFLQCAAASAALSPLAHTARAATPATNLVVSTRTLAVNGKAATVYSLADPSGRPGLTLDEGARFSVRLDNRLSEETIVHWHGLTPPIEQDGVAGNPMPMLKAGESRDYDFAVDKPGTFWMHAHTLQEQNLLAAPLIVRSAADKAADRQEIVLMLHDFSFTPAEELLARLGPAPGAMDHSGMGGMNHGMMQGHGMMHGGMQHGGMQHGGMQHGMGGMDLNDIAYDAYLANDRTLDDPEVVQVDKGGKVLVRIINAASSTAFTIASGTLATRVVAVDGRPVVPLATQAVPLSMGQRADLEIDIPADGGAFPILALREGAPERTGIFLATAGAAISKIEGKTDAVGPVLDLDFESRLVSAEALAERPADIGAMVHLMGSMQPYAWSMMGADALQARIGDRVEIAIMNMSMMSHPMHMHGHDFQVVGIDGARISGAVRDTVLVPPMRTVTIALDVNRAGRWPFHCHHLYHMVTGMMNHVDFA